MQRGNRPVDILFANGKRLGGPNKLTPLILVHLVVIGERCEDQPLKIGVLHVAAQPHLHDRMASDELFLGFAPFLFRRCLLGLSFLFGLLRLCLFEQ